MPGAIRHYFVHPEGVHTYPPLKGKYKEEAMVWRKFNDAYLIAFRKEK